MELELLEPYRKMEQVRITSSGNKGLVLLYLEKDFCKKKYKKGDSHQAILTTSVRQKKNSQRRCH